LQGIQRICAECGNFLIEIAALSVVAMLLSGCQPAAESTAESTIAAIPEVAPAALCGEQSYLSTELFGALAGQIAWTAADFECEGMPRPGGQGARLRFAGDVPGESQDQRKIAFIIALPELRRGEIGTEYKSKVTVIEEGVGRFFSTHDNDICWTDIVEFQEIDESDSKFTVAGALYCVAPLVEINGDSDVTFRNFKFRGQLDWAIS
jgi:hypothetical protein